MRSFFEKYLQTPRKLRSIVALSLSALSMVVIGVGYQLNVYQTQLHTQVLVTTPSGQEEQMIFRDFREQQVHAIERMLEGCLERNQLFGDGTGAVCERYEQQQDCVADAMTEDRVLECMVQ